MIRRHARRLCKQLLIDRRLALGQSRASKPSVLRELRDWTTESSETPFLECRASFMRKIENRIAQTLIHMGRGFAMFGERNWLLRAKSHSQECRKRTGRTLVPVLGAMTGLEYVSGLEMPRLLFRLAAYIC